MSNYTKTISILLSIVLMGVFSQPANSAIPNQINYQGRLADNTGTQVPDGPYDITFSVYNDINELQWNEVQNGVLVINGIFNVLLPRNPGIEPFPAGLFNESLYIGVQVGADDEMVPLQPLTSVPFAFKAEDADTLQGLAPDSFVSIESDPTVELSVKDGVSWTELSDIPSDIADGDAVGIIEEDDPTVQPSVKDGVSWSELSDILPGFADDVDNNAGGDITAIVVGEGLTGGGVIGDVPVKVDFEQAQSRVNGFCPEGSSIRAINDNGSVICESDTTIGDGHSLDADDGLPEDALYVDGFGHIGIGTDEPNENLEIRSPYSPTLRIASDSAGLSRLQLFEIVSDTPYGFSFDYDGTNNEMYLWTTGSPAYEEIRMTWERNTGEIGIGTLDPTELLHIENTEESGRSFLKLETSHATDWGEVGLRIQTPQNMWHLRMDDVTNNNITTGALALRSQNTGSEVMVWQESGNVGIGTTTPENKLDVRGTIRAEEIIVEIGWADYVFEEEYDVMSLEDLENFIERSGHLPGLPTEQEVQETGIGLGGFQVKLLEKVEELTLYIIEQNKILAKQEKVIAATRAELNTLRHQVNNYFHYINNH